MSTRTYVKYDSIDYEVEFHYYAGHPTTHYEPGEPEAVELENVFINGENISAIVGDSQWGELEDLIINEGKERILEAEIARYENERDREKCNP